MLNLHYPQILLKKGFLEYLNNNFKGKKSEIQVDGVRLEFFVKSKFGFKVGYLIGSLHKNGKKLTEKEEIQILDKIEEVLRKQKKFDFAFPPIHLVNFNNIPTGSKGCKLGIISLNFEGKSINDLFSGLKSVYRRHIKNAERDGVQVCFGLEYFDDFYEVYSSKLKSENAVHDSKSTILKLINDSKNDLHVQCGVARLNGKIEAGILNFSDENAAYYFYGGSKRDAHNGSFRLLHWKLIETYKNDGLLQYQLGAYRGDEIMTEKHQRLADFKLGFGAKIIDGYHFDWIISKWKYKIYKFLIKIKS